MNGAVETTQPSIDLPAKRTGKPTARVVVAETEATAPGEPDDTPIPPLPIRALAKPEKEASGATALREFPNPWLRVLDDLFGGWALPARGSIDFAALRSTGWAVQLGAPKSEADAKRDLKRVHARYGSALRGSRVGLRKVLVKGETAYRLRVVDLSRNEAAALCSRVKGDGGSCSIVR
jgi:hypothetical protein